MPTYVTMEKYVVSVIADVLISKGKRNQYLRGGVGMTVPGIAHWVSGRLPSEVGRSRQPASLKKKL